MKTLTKIKLINWHIFANETIELTGNTLITGENGSGKSTILDAMQFVLTAGSTKFNMAANESSTRTLVSYVKGKLGIEGKEFLRSGDVISHIALEIYNEESQTTQVLGVVIEVGVQKTAKSHFYKVDHGFSDAWFLDGTKVHDYSAFKQNLKSLKLNMDIPTNATERRSLFMNTLGLDAKYRELIPRALAFRPVDDIQDFIYRYLLNEKDIDIESLRESIREYRRLEKQLEHEHMHFQKLEVIHTLYHQYVKQEHEVQTNDVTIRLLELNQIKDVLDSLKKKRNENTIKIERLTQDRDQHIERLQKNQDSLVMMRMNPSFERLEALRVALKQSRADYETNEKLMKKAQREYDTLIGLLKKVGLNEKHHAFDDIDSVKQQLSPLSKRITEKSKAVYLERINLQLEVDTLQSQRQSLEADIERLKHKQQVYPEHVKKLIQMLKHRLSEYYHEDVTVRPLFEFLDIVDESWRNAIEGYLNTQRFNIIIEPRYFDMAVKLYDQYKHELKVYGVRIVDVLKTQDRIASEGSLANHITTKDAYAQGYINYLLGSVICVDHVSELKEHPVSITKEAMVYKGFAVYAIRPEIYQRPYIGQAAIALQMKRCQSEHQKLMLHLSDKKEALARTKQHEELLESVDMRHLELTIHNLSDRETLRERVTLNEQAISQIEDNPDLAEQLKRAEHLDLSIKTLNDHITQTDREIGGLSKAILTMDEEIETYHTTHETMHNTIETMKQENMQQIMDAELVMTQTLQDNQHNHQRAMNVLQSRNKTLMDSFEQQRMHLLDEMMTYNNMSNSGYGRSIDNIEQYLNRYYRLRDIDLIESANSCRMAREKSEQQFHESFIHQLAQNIQQAQKSIRMLNNQLKMHTFRDEQYRFSIAPSQTPHFAQYYKIITSDKEAYPSNLFMQMLSEQESTVMKELFRRLSTFDDESKNEAELRRYTDYRNYMSYDIITTKENGDVTRLSTVIKEKSGGKHKPHSMSPSLPPLNNSFQRFQWLTRDASCFLMKPSTTWTHNAFVPCLNSITISAFKLLSQSHPIELHPSVNMLIPF